MRHDEKTTTAKPATAAREKPAKIVAGTTARAAANNRSVSPEIEAAWADWSRRNPQRDEPGTSRLRAAFEAGWEAAERRPR